MNTDSTPRTEQGLPDIKAALRLFDETTRALEARTRRLDEVLTVKQRELEDANRRLGEQYAELDRLHAWLEQVLGAVESGVLAVDADGRVTTCNRAARHMLGAAVDGELPTAHPLRRVLDSGQAEGPWERELDAGDGERRVIAGRTSPIRDADERLVGAVEVFEDVTELRALRRQLEQVERLKAIGEMAAGMAHEIRNPLNGIEGFASLLARDLGPDHPARRYLDAITDGVHHLEHTVGGLLEYTRPREPQRRAIDPVALAESCLELVRAEGLVTGGRRQRAAEAAERATAELELVDAWSGRGAIAIDGSQIRQVLLNLIQNAVLILAEHRPGAGRVRLTVGHAHDDDLGDCCLLAVDDDGPGIPERERERVFLPFHTTREAGTGLGLAVTHALVQLHGGRIAVADSDLGGAGFRVWLPLVPAA